MIVQMLLSHSDLQLYFLKNTAKNHFNSVFSQVFILITY